jgi:hypothetical protein
VSPYVYVLCLAITGLYFMLEQLIEIALPMGLSVEPYKICSTVLCWVKTGVIPEGNLTVYLLKDIREKMKGFAFRPSCCHQIKCTKPVMGEDIFQGLRCLCHIILYCNYIAAPIASYTQSIDLYKRCLKGLCGLSCFGCMGGQHVLGILSWSQVIHPIGFAKLAIVGQ